MSSLDSNSESQSASTVSPQESTLGFDRDRRISSKLGRTLLLIVLGGFFLIFTALIFAPGWNPWWRALTKIVIEVCWSFWVIAMVFVWWSPQWLRSIYLHAERRMLLLTRLLFWVATILLVIAIALYSYLTHIGVLPLQPK